MLNGTANGDRVHALRMTGTADGAELPFYSTADEFEHVAEESPHLFDSGYDPGTYVPVAREVREEKDVA